MALKEAAGIKFAFSDPCFEFWLLLHEEFTTAPFADCGQVIQRLEVHWRNYSKGLSPTPEFLEKIPAAVLNAERCRKHHETSGGDWNPSTQVDILARHLNLSSIFSKRKSLICKLPVFVHLLQLALRPSGRLGKKRQQIQLGQGVVEVFGHLGHHRFESLAPKFEPAQADAL